MSDTVTPPHDPRIQTVQESVERTVKSQRHDNIIVGRDQNQAQEEVRCRNENRPGDAGQFPALLPDPIHQFEYGHQTDAECKTQAGAKEPEEPNPRGNHQQQGLRLSRYRRHTG